MENCFDETGLDDVFFTLHEEVTKQFAHSLISTTT